jgi:hypothetical protein
MHLSAGAARINQEAGMGGSVAELVPDWRAGEWVVDGSLEAVGEINYQCLGYLMEMAGGPSSGSLAIFGNHAADWRELPDNIRTQLSLSPCLLVDAGFDDETRWRDFASRASFGVPKLRAEPAFIGPGAPEFIRRVFMFAWHLARCNRFAARVILGMPPQCAHHIGRLRLDDLDWLAAHSPGWVRPRWEREPRIWRHLLRAAREPNVGGLTHVRLRTLQLMAGELLATSERILPLQTASVAHSITDFRHATACGFSSSAAMKSRSN